MVLFPGNVALKTTGFVMGYAYMSDILREISSAPDRAVNTQSTKWQSMLGKPILYLKGLKVTNDKCFPKAMLKGMQQCLWAA